MRHSFDFCASLRSASGTSFRSRRRRFCHLVDLAAHLELVADQRLAPLRHDRAAPLRERRRVLLVAQIGAVQPVALVFLERLAGEQPELDEFLAIAVERLADRRGEPVQPLLRRRLALEDFLERPRLVGRHLLRHQALDEGNAFRLDPRLVGRRLTLAGHEIGRRAVAVQPARSRRLDDRIHPGQRAVRIGPRLAQDLPRPLLQRRAVHPFALVVDAADRRHQEAEHPVDGVEAALLRLRPEAHEEPVLLGRRVLGAAVLGPARALGRLPERARLALEPACGAPDHVADLRLAQRDPDPEPAHETPNRRDDARQHRAPDVPFRHVRDDFRRERVGVDVAVIALDLARHPRDAGIAALRQAQHAVADLRPPGAQHLLHRVVADRLVREGLACLVHALKPVRDQIDRLGSPVVHAAG